MRPGICGGQSRLSESRKALALLKTNTSRKRRRKFCEREHAISKRSKSTLSQEPMFGYQNRMFCDVALGASDQQFQIQFECKGARMSEHRSPNAKPNGNPVPKIEIWKGEHLIFNDEELDCLQFIRKVLSDCKIRWSLHKAFLDAWEGKIPTEVWLDVIKDGIEFTAVLVEGLPPDHPWRARAEAKAAELCAALQPHLQWMEKRIARAS